MSFVAHYVGQGVGSAGDYGTIRYDGVTFTVADITTVEAPPAGWVGIKRDKDDNFYFAMASAIWKYDSTLSRITTWGDSGVIEVTAVNRKLARQSYAINSQQQLFIAPFMTVSTSSVVLQTYAYNSAGVSLWVSTITALNGSDGIIIAPNGNVIVGTNPGTVVEPYFYEYNSTTGVLTDTYNYDDMSSADYHGFRASACITAGQMVIAGTGQALGSQFEVFTQGNLTATTVLTWSTCTVLPCGCADRFNSLYFGAPTNTLGFTINRINFLTGAQTTSVSFITATTAGNSIPGAIGCSSAEVFAITSGGTGYVFSNSNVSLVAQVTVNAFIQDIWISNWGIDGIVPPREVAYSKYLVAFANNQVWWDSTAGTMAEITAASGMVSTANPLKAADAFQKVFVANEDAKIVLDFANHKVFTTALGANIPTHGTILTGATSSATMVVDYLTNSSASCEIYGFRTTTVSFISGETVANAALSVSFAIASAAISAPHVYNWTAFAQDTTTFGNLPARATLVCRYRGRLVLSGNNRAPHQWYMSRLANPWDWNYVANDPLAPVAGQDADAGEIGDVIVSLIAFGDDFLGFGCANSIHVLKGDPANGGSIDELDHTTGIWGSRAWCRDDANNIYFYGTGGLYKINNGLNGTENLSQSVIPTLVPDWAADPSTHRIVLAYDSDRACIVITRTTLFTGANTSYVYNLLTQSYYPEELPNDCGVYCAHSYDSNDPTYKTLLLGCTDGYLRRYDDARAYDETDTAIATITAYAGWVVKLTGDDDEDAVLNHITVETAGGVSTVSIVSSDSVDLYFYTGDDADSIVENMAYNTLAFYSVNFSGTGVHPKERVRVRTKYLGIKAYGNVTGQTWAINRISGDVEQTGDTTGVVA